MLSPQVVNMCTDFSGEGSNGFRVHASRRHQYGVAAKTWRIRGQPIELARDMSFEKVGTA